MNKKLVKTVKTIFNTIRGKWNVLSYDWWVFWTKVFDNDDIDDTYNFVIDMNEFDQEGKNKMMNILKEHGINVTPKEDEELSTVIINFA